MENGACPSSGSGSGEVVKSPSLSLCLCSVSVIVINQNCQKQGNGSGVLNMTISMQQFTCMKGKCKLIDDRKATRWNPHSVSLCFVRSIILS